MSITSKVTFLITRISRNRLQEHVYNALACFFLNNINFAMLGLLQAKFCEIFALYLYLILFNLSSFTRDALGVNAFKIIWDFELLKLTR